MGLLRLKHRCVAPPPKDSVETVNSQYMPSFVMNFPTSKATFEVPSLSLNNLYQNQPSTQARQARKRSTRKVAKSMTAHNDSDNSLTLEAMHIKSNPSPAEEHCAPIVFAMLSYFQGLKWSDQMQCFDKGLCGCLALVELTRRRYVRIFRLV